MRAEAETVPAPSTQAVAAALAGMAAAWLAAGSTGLLTHALRHGLTWLALAVAVLVSWPSWQTWRERLVLAAALVVAAVMIAPAMAVYNVLGVGLVLAMLARASQGRDERILLVAAFAACVLGVYLLACTSIATVWSMADALGGAFGSLAARVSGKPLSVGATLAGLDFLVLMAAVYVAWLVRTRPPRLARALLAAAAILCGHLAYLVLLSHSTDLYDALPPAPPPPEFRDYIPPPWSWSDAARSLLPWNLPLLAGVIHLGVAAAMFRSCAWLPLADDRLEQGETGEGQAGRAGLNESKRKQGKTKQGKRKRGDQKRDEGKQHETRQGRKTYQPVPSSDPLQTAITSAAVVLAVLVPVLTTLAPGKSDLTGKKIIAYEQGYLDWERPVHDSYGRASAGLYGMLPEFIASLGGRFERSAGLSQEDLAEADVLLLIHPVYPWTPDQLERIWDFVRRGGSLLVVAETMLQEGDLRSSFNEVLDPTGIEVRFDAAHPAAWNWQYAYATMAHPAATALGDRRNRFGIVSGPSIRTRWPARPILLGRWGWSDPGHDSVLTGVYRYDAGERLGDLVLAAERRFGSGTVVVLSDTSSLTNQGNVNSYVFTGRLLAYLAGRAGNPQAAWRQLLGFVGCLALLGVMAWPLFAAHSAGHGNAPPMGGVATVAVVLGLALAGSRTFSHLSMRVVPDGRGHRPENNVAYIDASHLEAYSDAGWGFDGVAGLALTLMRNGYQPFLLPQVTSERLDRAGMLISIAPARPFSQAERTAVRRFVEGGGIFIATVGAEQAGPIQPLLDEFELRVPRCPVPPTEKDREPTPMGHFTTLYRPQGVDYDAGVLFYTGWPIECDRSEELVRGFDNLPLVALHQMGRGKVVLIGDTAFAMNKNLEYVGGQPFGGRYDNAHFWRWLITLVTEQEDWLPPRKTTNDE